MIDACFEVVHDGYRISTDPELLDLTSIYQFLSNSFWSPG